LFELICKPYSLVHISLSLVPKLPSKPSTNLGAPQALKGLAFELVIRKVEVQQLERRGQMVVSQLFDALVSDPEALVPQASWHDGCTDCSAQRQVCDYVSGMTDSYAEKLYKRLFQPGFGSSGDEL
jgi:dGTPase